MRLASLKKCFSHFPHEGPYTITSTNVPSSALPGSTRIFISGEGQSVLVPAGRLPLGPVNIWELGLPDASIGSNFPFESGGYGTRTQ